MFPKYYTPKQVAEILQIHQYTVLKWIRDGKLKALKFGRVYRATESDLAEFLGTSRSQSRIPTEVSRPPEAMEELSGVKMEVPVPTVIAPQPVEDHYVL